MPRHPPPPGWTRDPPPYAPDDAIRCLVHLAGLTPDQAGRFLVAWQRTMHTALRAGHTIWQHRVGQYKRIPYTRTHILTPSPAGPVNFEDPRYNPTLVPTRYPHKIAFTNRGYLLKDPWPEWPGGPRV